MNRFAFMILGLLACIGCKDKVRITSLETAIVLVNKTDKEVVYEDNHFTLNSKGLDSIVKTVKYYGETVTSLLAYYVEFIPNLSFKHHSLYVLKDTLSYTYYPENDKEEMDRIDSVFLLHYTVVDENISHNDAKRIVKIVVDNELLLIFKKDTSMLVKFEDYYKIVKHHSL